jgi:hypothetical protein
MYEFDADGKDALADVAAVRAEVTSLQSKARVAVLPINPGVFLTLLLWLLIMCGTSDTDGIGSTYVQVLKTMAHFIFQNSANTKIALYVLIAAHACEALYAWTRLSDMKMDTFSKISWGALILVFGFPVTSQVIFLHKYWKRNNNSCGKKNE